MIRIKKYRSTSGWRYGLYEDGNLVEGGFFTWAAADMARDELLSQRAAEEGGDQ